MINSQTSSPDSWRLALRGHVALRSSARLDPVERRLYRSRCRKGGRGRVCRYPPTILRATGRNSTYRPLCAVKKVDKEKGHTLLVASEGQTRRHDISLTLIIGFLRALQSPPYGLHTHHPLRPAPQHHRHSLCLLTTPEGLARLILTLCLEPDRNPDHSRHRYTLLPSCVAGLTAPKALSPSKREFS